MKNTKAIFFKQFQSLLRNPGMIVQAVLFLILVIIMNFLIGGYEVTDCESCIPAYVCTQCLEEDANVSTPDPSLVGLFTVMFVGFAIVGSAAALVIEDKTTQNLRFMTMAGIKPFQYLLGTIPAIFIIVFVVVVLFSLVGRYFGADMVRFVSVTSAGALVSTLLGVALGLSKGPTLATPLGIVLGLGPMLSTFNETLARYLRFTYTQQINLAVSDLSQDISSNFLIIGINGLVVLLIFVWMHRKGELRW